MMIWKGMKLWKTPFKKQRKETFVTHEEVITTHENLGFKLSL